MKRIDSIYSVLWSSGSVEHYTMMITELLIVVTLCFCVSHAVSDVCKLTPPIVETLRSGRKRYICEYEGVRMDVKSEFVSMDCEECKCTEEGLRCCGIGYKAENISAPPGCDVIGDACEPISVKSCDKRLSCDTGKPIYKHNLPPLDMRKKF